MTSPFGKRQRPYRMTWQRSLLLVTVLVAVFLRLYQLDLLPPGLFYDEAYNGLDVRAILSGAQLPLFFAGNNGREPLFLYLQALIVAGLGHVPYALRVTAALAGIATVPVVYWLAHTLLRGEGRGAAPTSHFTLHTSHFTLPGTPYWLATIAAAGLAVSYWHVSVSRLGFRAILLPLVSSLVIGFFWRAWTGRRRRDFVLAGVWLGGALYTYTAARVLPLVLVAFVAIEAIIYLSRRAGHGVHRDDTEGAQRDGMRSRTLPGGLLLTIVTTLVVAAPLLLVFAREPALLGSRTGDISIFTVAQVDMPGTPAERLIYNALAVAGNFYVAGDEAVRHNLPGRPVNDLLLAALFTLGIGAALWRIRQPAMRLLLLWLAVMAAPTLFSTQAPHVLRGIGMLPPLAVLTGVGGGVLLAVLPRWRGWLAPGLVILVLVVPGYLTYRDYFLRWPQSDRFGAEFSIGEQLAAETIAARWEAIVAGRGLVVPRDLLLTPNVEFAVGQIPLRELAPSAPLDVDALTGVDYLMAGDASVMQSLFLLQGRDGQVVATRLGYPGGQDPPTTVATLAQTLDHTVLAAPQAGKSWPTLHFGALPADSPLLTPAPIRYPLAVRFANGLTLAGYDLAPERLEAEGALRLITFWRVDNPGAGLAVDAFELFAHLVLPDGRVVQQNGGLGEGWPPERWQPGALYDDVRTFTLPAVAPAGRADLVVGLYDPTSADGSRRIGIVDANGVVGADQVLLGSVAVQKMPPPADLAGLTPVQAVFEDRIALVGYAVEPAAAGGLTVELVWRARDRVPTEYTAFVHLLDQAGTIISQQDRPPGGDLPTTRWLPDETLRTTFSLPAPSSDLPGVTLRVGLYEPVSGRQLAVQNADTAGANEGAATFILLPVGQAGAVTP